MANKVEYFKPGQLITMTVEAGQVVRGGRMVAATADRVVREAAAASVTVVGYAVTDGNGDVDGQKSITVATGGVWPCTAAGAITQGARLATGAAGTVAAIGANTFDTKVGIALEDIADGAEGRVLIAL